MIRQAGIPVVENGNLSATPLDSVVSYSNFEAARAMTLHLSRMGYRHIGFVSLATQENDRARERRRGFLAALAELGRKPDERLIMERPSGLAAGVEAVVQMIETVPEVDAVFFAGDVLAIGAVLECQRRGWKVPGRIAIASFDDLDLLRHAVPTVTTLRIPRQDIGLRSAELLVNRLHGAPREPVRIDLGFEIVQREST
jgi:LacI family gluconate utilization system Gnt-I transcriptional repressor